MHSAFLYHAIRAGLDMGIVNAGNPRAASAQAQEGFVEDDPSTWGNPGRNETCPCGSGKKFKHCHGRML